MILAESSLRMFPDRKTAIDPIFGLAATRDSRAMDNARSKNFSYDKRLKTAIKTIEQNEKSQLVRSLSRRALAQDFLEKINPKPDKRIVCPPGLSPNQRQAVRLLRQASGPSMTLDEFDQKLSDIRSCRQITLAKPSRKAEKDTRKQMSEYKIKRSIYKRNSKITLTDKSALTDEASAVVSESDTLTHYPLYRRKSVVEETYQRITSADIVHISGKSTSMKYRSKSEADQIREAQSQNSFGVSRERLPDIASRRRMLRLRRNTVPDHSASVENNPHLSSSLKALSLSKSLNEGSYDKFLGTLRAQHHLPQLQHNKPVSTGDIAV